MQRTALVALLSLVCALPATAQGITVSSPAANVTWLKGSSYAIQWTIQNYSPPSVAIFLVNPTDTTTVVTIAGSAPNPGPYQWSPIPASVPPGQYRVKVVVMNQWSGTSGVFTIQAPSGGPGLHHVPSIPVPAATRAPGLKMPPGVAHPITITYPANMVEWELNHPYTIRWTALTSPEDGFDVDLYTGAGTKVEQLLSGAATPQGQNSWSFDFKPWCNLTQGDYRIRIKSWLYGSTATSGPITLVVRTKQHVENIPIQVENADIYYSNIGSTLIDCSRTIPPGKARVGYDYSSLHNKFSYHAFRARLTADLSVFNGKKGNVEKAVLITGDMQGCPGNEHTFCGAQLFALAAGEAGRWNTFQATAVPYQLTGWSTPFNPAGYDVTAAVRAWLNGSKPNLGFVTVSGNDGFSVEDGHSKVCVSFFKPIMYVTFIEKPNPCQP